MKQLSIQFLGKPIIAVDGQMVRFPTRKSLALFAYLVAEGGSHSREKLMALLWPDSPTSAAQASLRNDLARLRKALGVAGSVILASTDAIAFDAGGDFTIDLIVLRTALPHIEGHPSHPVLPHLHAAISAYQGEFLQGFSLGDAPDFDHWATQQRQQWRQSISRILEFLTHDALEQHAAPEALALAGRWAQHDPTNEAAYRGLMQAYFLAGDRMAALQVYQSCQSVLANEQGTSLAPETTALAKTISHASPDSHRRVPRPAAIASVPVNLPLVGRTEEFAQLVTSYRAAEAGTLQAVAVIGESGVGKTRLVADFLNWATLQGSDFLHGRAFEAGGQLPYQPIARALRERLEQENAPEDLLADVWLAELSLLLPELLERYPDLENAYTSYDNDQVTARARLFEAVARLGLALSHHRPLVFFLDDWHWADDASRDLLHYLGQSWRQSQAPILVVLTMRSEEMSARTDVAEWLVAWERHVPTTYLWLKRLTATDVFALVKAWGAPDQDISQVKTLSDRLFVETAGNPFFLIEVMQLLAAKTGSAAGAIDLGTVLNQIEAESILPPNVRKAVLSRLAKLGATATDLLAAAAVLGRNCRFGEMCQVSGVDELAGLPALDVLLNGQLILETDDAQAPYMFAHDRVRDVVYTEAGHSRRRIFHQRAFAALSAATPPAPPAELAYHAEKSQLADEARHYLQLAGDAARDLYQNDLAIDYYRRALALTPAGDADHRHDLIQRIGPSGAKPIEN